MEEQKLRDKVRGCIIGGACGDALGYPVEFVYSFSEIQDRYGEGGIKEYDLGYPWMNQACNEAQISDDTQMTLYTIEGLLQASQNKGLILRQVTANYLAWYFLQMGERVPPSNKSELTEIYELNQRRAPGNTCLSALEAIKEGRTPFNCSKGCGGVMRVAPVGLFGALNGWSVSETAQKAAEIAEITHHHILSSYSSALLALIIRDIILLSPRTTDEFTRIVDKSLGTLENLYGKNADDLTSFLSLIRLAMSKASDPRADWEVIESELGEGWVAEETIAIAIFSVLRHFDDFLDCIVSAVNHGGDSDSTGAVAGNISGAILGLSSIPKSLVKKLQLTELMIRKSDEMIDIIKPLD